MTGSDAPRIAPAAQRNLAPILASLARHAPKTGRALEIASGTGQQIPAFAAAHPDLIWQATDRDAANLGTMRAWASVSPAPNLLPPCLLDAAQPGWSLRFAPCDLVIMVNLLHLIPEAAATVVVQEAAKVLAKDGCLLIYGPFLRACETTSPGDAEFHAALRAADPANGYKDAAWVRAQLAAQGLDVMAEDMPANNIMFIAFKT